MRTARRSPLRRRPAMAYRGWPTWRPPSRAARGGEEWRRGSADCAGVCFTAPPPPPALHDGARARPGANNDDTRGGSRAKQFKPQPTKPRPRPPLLSVSLNNPPPPPSTGGGQRRAVPAHRPGPWEPGQTPRLSPRRQSRRATRPARPAPAPPTPPQSLRAPSAALYAGAVGGCLSNAMRAGSTDHRNEVWCSQRPLEIACALPANFLWPRA